MAWRSGDFRCEVSVLLRHSKTRFKFDNLYFYSGKNVSFNRSLTHLLLRKHADRQAIHGVSEQEKTRCNNFL